MMISITFLGGILGILYAVSNPMLISYLREKVGVLSLVNLTFPLVVLCAAFLNPLN